MGYLDPDVRTQLTRLLNAAEGSPKSLQRLSLIAEIREVMHELLVQTVAEARMDGEVWAAIGDALGVSGQAATQRFGLGGRYDVVSIIDEVVARAMTSVRQDLDRRQEISQKVHALMATTRDKGQESEG